MGTDKESEIAHYLSKIKIIKKIGNKIIEFLAQLEEFQKKMWLKKKFVVDTNYCITLDRVPDQLYEKIIINIDQINEWDSLFCIKEIKSDQTAKSGDILFDAKSTKKDKIDFLKQNPFFVLDTKFFDDSFKEELLSSMENFDEKCDGLLIHSENFQALNLLQERYKEQVKCVYIDPPYNTGDSKILYKNEYDSSAWLTLMWNRISLSKHLIKDDFVYFIAIDDYEMVPLSQLIDTHFNFSSEMIVINHHPQGGKAVTLANTHEYMLALMDQSSDRTLIGRQVSDDVEEQYYKRSGTAESNFRRYRPNSFYAFLVDPNTFQVVGIENPTEKDADYPVNDTDQGMKRIYPIGRNNTERVWRNAFETGKKLFEKGKIISTDSFTIYQLIEHGEKKTALFSNWTDSKYNAGTNGANLLNDIIGKQNPFSYPKSIYTVEDALFTYQDSNDSIILDFFGGSGTTGHAVINLNKSDNKIEEDTGKRKYILVEMGGYFDTVLKPRIQKVVYSNEWKNGKPVDREGVSHCFKYFSLESYEDTLNNLKVTKDNHLFEKVDKDNENIFINYLLDIDTKDSSSLLAVDSFTNPFDFVLDITENYEIKPKKMILLRLLITFWDWL